MVGFLQKHALICWVDKQLLHVGGHWFDVYLVVGEEASSCPTAINFNMISLECVRILCKGSTKHTITCIFTDTKMYNIDVFTAF